MVNGVARFVGTSAGRRTKWLVLLTWLFLLVLVGSQGSKMFTLQKNSAISALPDSAESVKADRQYQKFPQSKRIPALIIYQRGSALTDTDRARIDADRAAVSRKITKKVQVHEATFARDGTTAVVRVDLPVPGTALSFDETANVADSVRAVQHLVGRGDGGLAVAVTGQAGYTTANADIMSDVNTTLFLAALLLLVLVLIVAHRSPWLWAVTLAVGGVALAVAEGAVYLLGRATGLTYTTLSQGLLTVLTVCVSTGYALPLVSRYREELRGHADKHEAMSAALPRAGRAAVVSAVPVVGGLLCLMAADLRTTRGLGPVGAVAVLCGLAAAMTLLPAVLLVFGRWILWPLAPRFGDAAKADAGFWGRLCERVGGRPRRVWAVTAVVLAALSVGLFASRTGLSTDDTFAGEPQAVVGQQLLARELPAGSASPVTVVVRSAAEERVLAALRADNGLTQAGRAARTGDLSLITAVPTSPPASPAALRTVTRVRDTLGALHVASATVGGPDAVALDTADAESRDRKVVVPLMLLAMAVLLGLLFRAVVAPVVLISTVFLTYTAALGVSVALNRPLFGFSGQEGTLALHSLAYLVTFTVGSGVFLLTRVEEESVRLGRSAGTVRAVAATVPAITGAALVVAALFAALGLIPLVGIVQVALVVALGVLLDGFVVRPLLLPALLMDLGERSWWPRPRSARSASGAGRPAPAQSTAGTVAGGRDV